MKCPKCNYIGFDHLSTCKKCGHDLTKVREQLNIPLFDPLSVETLPICEEESVGEVESVVAPTSEEPYKEEPIQEVEAKDSEELPLELGDVEIEKGEEDIITIDEGEIELSLEEGEDKGLNGLMTEVTEELTGEKEDKDKEIIEIPDVEIEEIQLEEGEEIDRG